MQRNRCFKLLCFGVMIIPVFLSGCGRSQSSKSSRHQQVSKRAVVCPAVPSALSCIQYSQPCPPHFVNTGFDVLEATSKNTEFARASWSKVNGKAVCLYVVTAEGARHYVSLEYTGDVKRPDAVDGEGDWHPGHICEGSSPEDCPFYPIYADPKR